MNKLYFYILFIVLFIGSYLALEYEKDIKIQQHLDTKTKQYLQNYNVLYSEYKKLSTIIFKTKVDTREIRAILKETLNGDKKSIDTARIKLYNTLNDTYRLLQEYNIKQLHFHLKNNDSFLRFHRPNKFGDNLSNIRATVKYVNEYKKPIDGFEEGRIYNGYRFVFPLFDNDIHLGSVEVSFSTLAMNKEFMDNFDVIGTFMISKDVVKEKVFNNEKSNYRVSQFEDFYFEKKINDMLQILNKRNYDLSFSEETKQFIKKNAFNTISFSLYDTASKSIMTFIKVQNPISNKVVGMLVIRSDATYIFNKINNFYFLLAAVTLFILLLLIYIYRVLNQKDILNKLVDEKTVNLNNLNRELEESEHELQILNENLELRIAQEVAKNRDKDKMLFEQTKMAALGEMIGNIAHQWRQPLSAISSSVSSMYIQKEIGSLSDESFFKVCDSINNNAQFLSKTIDDFRNFIRGESIKEVFNLKQSIDSLLNIVSSSIKKYNIKMVIDIDDNIDINGLQNELNQCLINLFNNSKDALENIQGDRYIFIEVHHVKDNLIIKFKDNGGGINENILDKVFEPYFTTKHQSQGTGLGLNMVYRLIVEGMSGSIYVQNDTFYFNDQEYTGAQFIINLPLTED